MLKVKMKENKMHFRLFDALLFPERKNYTSDKKDGVVAESIVCK